MTKGCTESDIKMIYLAPIAGYILGSISPSYFLGRVLRHIDLREYGDGNLGATNTKRVLGLAPAVITAIFDLSKGVLALYIAILLGAPDWLAYLTGLLAVVGHIFPFYLGFRGGQGAATAMGLLFYSFYQIITGKIYNLALDTLLALVVLGVLALGVYFISRRGNIVGLVTLPAAIALVFLVLPLKTVPIYLAIIFAFHFSIQVFNLAKGKATLNIPEQVSRQIFNWRSIARPLAALFVVISFFVSHNILLYFVGVIALFFIILDLLRLLIGRVNFLFFAKLKGFFKEKEKAKFSSMTLFLTAVFILYLVFPGNIASVAALFLIFGDLMAKVFGLIFGKTRFVTKTLEGTTAYFIFSLLAGFIFSLFTPLPFWILSIGALTAALVEPLSIFGIDDNFTVGLISGSVMYALLVLV